MTYITNSSDCTQQTTRPLVDIESLNEFFLDITEFIDDDYHNGECVSMTAQHIVIRSVKGADLCFRNPYAEMVDLMVELGWLKLVAIGTTFEGKLLYEI